MDSIRERLDLIGLTTDEYVQTLKASADRGIVGAAIYDAMLTQCALKARAETIYTWNLKHYAKYGPEVTWRLRTP